MNSRSSFAFSEVLSFFVGAGGSRTGWSTTVVESSAGTASGAGDASTVRFLIADERRTAVASSRFFLTEAPAVLRFGVFFFLADEDRVRVEVAFFCVDVLAEVGFLIDLRINFLDPVERLARPVDLALVLAFPPVDRLAFPRLAERLAVVLLAESLGAVRLADVERAERFVRFLVFCVPAAILVHVPFTLSRSYTKRHTGPNTVA